MLSCHQQRQVGLQSHPGTFQICHVSSCSAVINNKKNVRNLIQVNTRTVMSLHAQLSSTTTRTSATSYRYIPELSCLFMLNRHQRRQEHQQPHTGTIQICHVSSCGAVINDKKNIGNLILVHTRTVISLHCKPSSRTTRTSATSSRYIPEL